MMCLEVHDVVHICIALLKLSIGTLQSKLKNNTPANVRSGPPPFLSPAEKEMLEEWVIHMCKIGYGCTRDQLTLTIKAILDKDWWPNPFTDNHPGKIG